MKTYKQFLEQSVSYSTGRVNASLAAKQETEQRDAEIEADRNAQKEQQQRKREEEEKQRRQEAAERRIEDLERQIASQRSNQ